MKQTIIFQTFVAIIFCGIMAAHAAEPRIGDEQEVVACDRLRAQASWRDGPPRCRGGSDRQTCTYNPPPGWVIISHSVQVRSSSNGSRSVSTLGEGLDFMSEVEMREAYQSVLDMAARKGEQNLEAKIKDQYSDHVSDVRSFRTNKNTLQAVASARSHGSCLDRRRGWEEFSVRTKLRYLGQPSKSALEQELRSQFGLN